MKLFVFVVAITVSVSALADPQTLTDDDWTIKPRESQAQMFNLKGSHPVLLDAHAVKNADKGFTLRVLPRSVWEAFLARKVTRAALADYDNERATSVKRTREMAEGEWAIVVENSENILMRTTVHVRIVIDPAD